jgi:hypothetical protein
MTKVELYEAVERILSEDAGVSEATKNAVLGLIKPKVAGAKSVESYTVFDKDGRPAYIFCNIHKRWEPVAYEDEEGNIVKVFDEDPKAKNGYKRCCVEGDKAWKAATKALRNTEKAVLEDVLEGRITSEQGKALIEAAKEARTNPPARADGLGCDERPAPDLDPSECVA